VATQTVNEHPAVAHAGGIDTFEVNAKAGLQSIEEPLDKTQIVVAASPVARLRRTAL
jgi:hypothetical protein